MGVSKAQKVRKEYTCQCGCGETFYPFPVYGKKGEGLIYPIYKRGHHPNCRKSKPAWNKGLKKGDHPSIEKTGFQKGHKPYNDFSHIHELQRNNAEYRKRWLESKKGQNAWNKGLTKDQYPNGIKTGSDHGNWKGGRNGIKDTSVYKTFTNSILKRDNYTCQHCGDRNHEGRGKRIRLEVHHIIAASEDHTLILTPDNCITLCKNCHIKTDNYGTKLIHSRKNRGGN